MPAQADANTEDRPCNARRRKKFNKGHLDTNSMVSTSLLCKKECK